MSLIIPNTFVPGTKAKASEVNDNFTAVKSFVDGLESDISTAQDDITTLDASKANKSGSSGNRFAVADAVTAYDAMNKQSVEADIYNTRKYIDGFIITKNTSNSINITSGSCYDSTYTTMIKVDTDLSKTNSSQSISTTYYIYAIAKADGTSDILISTDSVTPSLPSGYTLFRQVGKYITDADNEISLIFSNQEQIQQQISTFPDWTNVVTISNNTEYTCPSDGYFSFQVRGYSGGNYNASINGVSLVNANSDAGMASAGAFVRVAQGDVVKANGSNYNRILFIQDKK